MTEYVSDTAYSEMLRYQEACAKLQQEACAKLQQENADLRLALADTVERCAKACVEIAKRPLAKVVERGALLGWQSAASFCEAIIHALSPTSIEEVRRMREEAERYRYAKENLFIGTVYEDCMTPWDEAAIDTARKT